MNKEKALQEFCLLLNIDRAKLDKNDGTYKLEGTYIRDAFWCLKSHSYEMSLDEISQECGFGGKNSEGWNKINAALKSLKDKGIAKRTVHESGRAYYSISDKYLDKCELYNTEVNEFMDHKTVIKEIYTKSKIEDSKDSTSSILNDTEKLCEYFQHIVHIEASIYSLKERCSVLMKKRTKFIAQSLDAYYNADKKIKSKRNKIKREIKDISAKISDVPKLTMSIKVPIPPKPKAPVFGMVMPQEPIFKKPGLFNRKKVETENANLIAKYNEQVAQYNLSHQEYLKKKNDFAQEMLKYDQTVEECKKQEELLNQNAYDASMANYESQKIVWEQELKEKEKDLRYIDNHEEEERNIILMESDIYKQKVQCEYEIEYIYLLIEQNVKLLNQLYSYGIIYKKYREMIPVSSFCDYFMSGRCTTLKGNDGAYNIYEQESRADQIIDKLDSIIDSLDEIKKNQFFLYNEIQNTNKTLGSIQNQLLVNNILQVVQIEQLNDIISNTEHIAYNTAVGAYYAQKNAIMTAALGFMMACG